MRFPGRSTREALPVGVLDTLRGRGGGRVLAWARAADGRFVVATVHCLYAVDAPGGSAPVLALDRAWHLVDAGSWSPESEALRVSFVDRSPAQTFGLVGAGALLQAFRERVQASVVLAASVDLGEGRSARVVVRKDLATGELLSQILLGPGVRSSEPWVMEATRAALAVLREQVE